MLITIATNLPLFPVPTIKISFAGGKIKYQQESIPKQLKTPIGQQFNTSILIMSSPSSSDLPPRKKQKLDAAKKGSHETSTQSEIIPLTQNELLQLSQSLISSSPSIKSSNAKSIVVKKGDKMSKKISVLLETLVEQDTPVLLSSSGDGIQKLLSIVEILKSKLKESEDVKFEQFNKLDKYETFINKNEILQKKRKVAVFNTLIRKVNTGDAGEMQKEWTTQEI